MFQFLELLKNSPVSYILFATVVGLFLGSFLNVLIHRIPIMMERIWRLQDDLSKHKEIAANFSTTKYNLITPNSHCPYCHKKIPGYYNIPLIGFMLLHGKCKQCKAKISWRYPIVELISALLLGLVAIKFGYTLSALAATVFLLALLTLTFIDFEKQLLPDVVTLPLLWLGLLFNLNAIFVDIQSAVLGAVVGYLILWSIYWIYKFITGNEGLGYGDMKMLAAIGAWCGWMFLPTIILIASVMAVVVTIGLMIFANYTRKTTISFGPYLALGGAVSLLWGKQILGI